MFNLLSKEFVRESNGACFLYSWSCFGSYEDVLASPHEACPIVFAAFFSWFDSLKCVFSVLQFDVCFLFGC